MTDCCTSAKETSPCCGGTEPSRFDGTFEDRFIDRWIDTPVGRVARVTTRLDWVDTAGRWKMRWGIGRGSWRVAPGLYCVGEAGPESPVLVTANYKMSFDALRGELGGMCAWILVLDTVGVNVWCAAGKGTFGTGELVRRVKATRLERLVAHRRLVLPQLGAPGVSAHRVRQESGFSVTYGPVRAKDIRRFLENGMKAEPGMRVVTFTTMERFSLAPVELVGTLKPLAWAAAALFLLGGIGPGIFSLGSAWHRGAEAVAVCVSGILGGAVLTPLLLPWLPGRAFSAKGALVGACIAGVALLMGRASVGMLPEAAMALAVSGISSFVAMNFTGATPFTSPSGVEKEMRRAIPLQAFSAVLAVVLWIGGAFIR